MATKSKKPTHNEILAAIKVMEDLGERGSASYNALVSQLPESMQPEDSFNATCWVTIVGAEDAYKVTEDDYEKLNVAIANNWEPITIKIGRKTWRVEISGRKPLEM